MPAFNGTDMRHITAQQSRRGDWSANGVMRKTDASQMC